MTDITIPREALEAAKREYIYCEDDDNCIEAACLAMLKSWPGMEYMMGDEAFPFHYIILPLTENQNDKT